MEKNSDYNGMANDFRIMGETRGKAETDMTLDDYIEFVTQANAFAGHPVRPFKPITGDRFLL